MGYFTAGTDYIGLIFSFASSATTYDVALYTNFATAIDNRVSSMPFVGGTFGGGAGTRYSSPPARPPTALLNMADYQNNHVSLPAGTPETKVVSCSFTDGQMNTVQDAVACTNAAAIASASGVELYNGGVLYNYGGFRIQRTAIPRVKILPPVRTISLTPKMRIVITMISPRPATISELVVRKWWKRQCALSFQRWRLGRAVQCQPSLKQSPACARA